MNVRRKREVDVPFILKCLRVESGLTVEEVASKIGVSPSTLRRFEFDFLPRADIMYKLCNIYGVRIDRVMALADRGLEATTRNELISIVVADERASNRREYEKYRKLVQKDEYQMANIRKSKG